jgi:hypothetical protein
MVHFYTEGKWMEDHSSVHWTEGLPSVIYSINTRTTHTTKKTPYQLVFGQEPRTNSHYWQSLHDAASTDDIQMDDLIIDKLKPNDIDIMCEKSDLLLLSKDSNIKSGLTNLSIFNFVS